MFIPNLQSINRSKELDIIAQKNAETSFVQPEHLIAERKFKIIRY